MTSDHIDTWLGIVQKLAILVGLAISGWYFLLKEEGSPHIKLSISHISIRNCVLRVEVEAENVGVREWTIKSAITRAFLPSTDRIYKYDSLSEKAIATQIRPVNQKLRPKEIAYFGFSLNIPNDLSTPFLVTIMALQLEEDDENSIRISEKSIPYVC